MPELRSLAARLEASWDNGGFAIGRLGAPIYAGRQNGSPTEMRQRADLAII